MSTTCLRLMLAALGSSLIAACSSKPAPPPAPATATARAPRDSVESICVRGDTTTMLLRSRADGKRRLQRWLFTPDGGVTDLSTGRTVMDSAQVARSGIRELFQQEAMLDEKESELARRSGTTAPVPAACR